MISYVSMRERLRRVKARRRVIIGRSPNAQYHATMWLERQILKDLRLLPNAAPYSIVCRLRPHKNPCMLSVECWAFHNE